MRKTLFTNTKWFIAAAACVMCLFSQKALAAIVFTDDFEFGPPTNINGGADTGWRASFNPWWTVGGSGKVTGTDAYSAPSPGPYLPPHSGNITAAFYSTSGDGVASLQTGVATSNFGTITYDLHFWVSNPVVDTAARQNLFSVSWNGVLLDLSSYDARFKTPSGPSELAGGPGQYVLDPNTNWFEVFIPNLAATSGSTELKFEGVNNNWATLVDDVMVQETPEPSSLLMLGAGALAIGLRRRRQRVV